MWIKTGKKEEEKKKDSYTQKTIIMKWNNDSLHHTQVSLQEQFVIWQLMGPTDFIWDCGL